MSLKTEIGLPVAATPPSQKVMATPRRRLGNRPPLAVGKMRRGAAHSPFGDATSPLRSLRPTSVFGL